MKKSFIRLVCYIIVISNFSCSKEEFVSEIEVIENTDPIDDDGQNTSIVWRQISSGEYHNIAIKSDGTLWAWGSNEKGQLGDGSYSDKSKIPVKIGNDSDWKEVFCGISNSFAIKNDGTLWAWGSNENFSLGIQGAGPVGVGVPRKVGSDSDWKYISAGFNHTLGLKIDGSLWSWGRTIALGLGSSNTVKTLPTRIGNENNWKNIASGHAFSLAIKDNGSLWSWGNNVKLQLGLGVTSSKSVPTRVGLDNDWVNIAGGEVHSLAIKIDGTLWAWGYNDEYQLGIDSVFPRNIPTQIGNDNNWKDIDASERFSGGLKTDGTLWVWGESSYGSFGLGYTSGYERTPFRVGLESNWKYISLGKWHSSTMKNDNTIWLSGSNEFGQIGDGTNQNKSNFTKINF